MLKPFQNCKKLLFTTAMVPKSSKMKWCVVRELNPNLLLTKPS